MDKTDKKIHLTLKLTMQFTAIEHYILKEIAKYFAKP